MRVATRDYARPQRPKPAAPRGRPVPRRSTHKKGGGTSSLGLPLWAWMVVSLSLLVFAGMLYYITRPVAPMDMAPSSGDKAATKGKAIEIPPKEPSRFAFYEMLPSYEVVVPEEVLNPTKPKPGTAANNLPQQPASAAATRADLPADSQPAMVAATKPAGRPTTAADVKLVKPAPAARDDEAAARLAAEIAREAPPQPTAQLAKGERFLIQVAAYRSKPDAEQRVAALALAGLSARVEQVTIDNKDTWYRVRLGPYGSAAAASAAQQGLKAQGFSGVVMKVKS
ncbi:MAG: SPOR domain-containing protein [Pseudomonadota bacterium]